MKTNDSQKTKIKGVCTLRFEDKNGNKETYVINNLVTNLGFKAMTEAIGGTLSHIALSDQEIVVNTNLTKLDGEVFRKRIMSHNATDNKIYCSLMIGHTEWTGNIKSVGVITNGQDDIGSGELFSIISTEHGDLPKTKTNQQTLTINWEYTLING